MSTRRWTRGRNPGTVGRMSTDADNPAPLDPKEQMKAALEAKKNAQHLHAEGAASKGKQGGAHGPQGGKRQFRRKAGG